MQEESVNSFLSFAVEKGLSNLVISITQQYTFKKY